jgi:hypothetical protein
MDGTTLGAIGLFMGGVSVLCAFAAIHALERRVNKLEANLIEAYEELVKITKRLNQGNIW